MAVSVIEVERLSAWVPDGPITEYSSLRFDRRLNDAETFEITLPYDRALAADLRRTGSGVRIIDNGVSWWGLAKRLTTVNDETMTVAGVSVKCLLADRVPIPQPGSLAGPWTLDEFHVSSGDPVGAWVGFLTPHIAASNARRLPQTCIVVPGGVSAGSVTIRGRWSPTLLEMVAESATGSGVVIDAELVISGSATQLVFTVSPLTTNTAVVFDPDLSQAIGWRILDEPDRPSNVYVGGAGEGTAREVVTTELTGNRRIERWIESSGTGDSLTAEAVAYLASNSSIRTLELDIDGDGPGYRFGVDYGIGDLVTVMIPDESALSARVTSVDTAVGSAGETVRKVTVGNGSIDLYGTNIEARRLGRLEGA